MALSTTQYGYIIDPMVPFTDGKGNTIKDGFVRVFVAGSSTPVITYRNFDGAANQDLIELDNSGRTKTSVIGSKGLTYKVCVYDHLHSQESPILTVDKVSVIGANITAGAGATVVTGLDGLTTKPDGFVDASIVGTDGYVAIDHTLVTDDLDTDAKVTAVENDRYVPLLNDDVNDPDSKMKLGRFWKWVLGNIKSLSTTITAFRTGDVIPVDGPSGNAKMSKDDLLKETAESAVNSGVAASAYDVDTFWLEKNLKYLQMGYLNADGTIGASTARGVTDYVEVDGIFKVATVSGIASIWAGGKTYACWYDENKAFISNETTDPASDDVVVVLRVPSGAKYVRFTMTNYWTDSTIRLIGGENLRYLENRIDETREWVNDNLSAKGTTLGYLNADGTIGTSTIRSTTDFIDIEGVERIDTKGNIASITASSFTFACFYDANKDFVAVQKTASASENVITSFAVPSEAKYIRFTCKNLSVSANFDIVGGDVIGVLHRNLDTLKESLTIYGSDLHEGKYEEGFLNADGTIGSSTYRGVTDYIDIEGATKVSIKSGVASIYSAGKTYACFYDKDKIFLSNLTTTSATDDVVEEASAPNQAKYIRITLNTKFEYATFSLLSDDGLASQAEDKNPYRLAKNFGKKFYLFGGSLTYNFAVTYDSWKKWVSELKMRKWRCYGQGGAGFSNTLTPNIQNQVGTVDSSADVYVLWCSGNDYYNQVEIGTPSDYTSDDSYDVTKLATQCGGMNYCIKKIYEKNPNATIVIMTSIKIFQTRNGWINEEGVGTHTLYDYVQAQKKVAERWGIRCLDQFAECGFNERNYTEYFQPDAGHITDVGYAKIISRQIEFLANTP